MEKNVFILVSLNLTFNQGMLDEFNSIRRSSDEIILSYFVPEQELLTEYVSLEMKKALDDWNKMAFNKNNLQLKTSPHLKKKDYNK